MQHGEPSQRASASGGYKATHRTRVDLLVATTGPGDDCGAAIVHFDHGHTSAIQAKILLQASDKRSFTCCATAMHTRVFSACFFVEDLTTSSSMSMLKTPITSPGC
jgi:hypothetical protein